MKTAVSRETSDAINIARVLCIFSVMFVHVVPPARVPLTTAMTKPSVAGVIAVEIESEELSCDVVAVLTAVVLFRLRIPNAETPTQSQPTPLMVSAIVSPDTRTIMSCS